MLRGKGYRLDIRQESVSSDKTPMASDQVRSSPSGPTSGEGEEMAEMGGRLEEMRKGDRSSTEGTGDGDSNELFKLRN